MAIKGKKHQSKYTINPPHLEHGDIYNTDMESPPHAESTDPSSYIDQIVERAVEKRMGREDIKALVQTLIAKQHKLLVDGVLKDLMRAMLAEGGGTKFGGLTQLTSMATTAVLKGTGGANNFGSSLGQMAASLASIMQKAIVRHL